MSLPPITRYGDLERLLEVWRIRLNNAIRRAPRLPAPANFRASASAATPNSILLEWLSESRADGYEIQRSDTGNFDSSYVTILIDDGVQESYLDNVGNTGVTKYYRILATSGTVSEPHSTKGQESAVVTATSNSGSTSYDDSDDDYRRGCPIKGTELIPLGEHELVVDEKLEDVWCFLLLEGGRHLVATPSHIIFTERKGRTRLDEVRMGDSVITINGAEKVESTGEMIESRAKCVVQMRSGHLYWANGILSHNLKIFS